ncbi:hypothetical protein MSG28_010714 [Choristoneura fumiferana]|uniref:Uncharacterized protein n=1 Tax=Choristoneura fumiferana TaxID=7141 RepID=A0ACC0KP40_CHOFU|nr:hypothetical protein MSG28_010714 [Choristoneura fumiferana]
MKSVLILLVVLAAVVAAPQRPTLQSGPTDTGSQPFIEEVVVESVLQVRAPAGRQARTNTRTDLAQGSRVAEKN